MPNGEGLDKEPGREFEKKLLEWEAKAKSYETKIKPLEKRAQELQAVTAMKAGWWQKWTAGGPLGSAMWSPTRWLAPVTGPTAPEVVAQKNEYKSIQTELIKNIFYIDLYTTVPSMILANKANSVDEALSMINVAEGLSAAELSQARDVISNMFMTRDTARPAEPGELAMIGELEYPELVAPTPAMRGVPTSLHQLSTAEIVKSLTAVTPPISRKTPEQWKEYLAELGWSEEDIDNEFAVRVDQLIAEAADRKSQIEEWQTHVADMPEYKMIDFLKELVIQPPLAVLEALNYYYEHVSMPAAGWLYRGIPDIDRAYHEFKAANPEATEREAFTYAWAKWEAPGPVVLDFILKYLIMEGIVDPVMYIPFVGWGIKALRAAGKGGPVIRALAVGVGGIDAVLEAPFDLVKWIGGTVMPKTISLRAAAVSRDLGKTIDAYITRTTGQDLSFINMKDFSDTVDLAIKHFADNPRSEDAIARAGHAMCTHTPVDDIITKDWITRLRATGLNTFSPDEITVRTLGDIDDIFERVFFKEITAEESAYPLLLKLGVTAPSEDAAKLATRLLTQRYDRIITNASKFARAKDGLAAMRSFMTDIQKSMIATETSKAALAARQSSRFSALLFDIPMGLQRVWTTQIDKWVVRPAAQSYLTFGMYGPMNVIEDVWRSTLGGVRPARMNLQQYNMEMIGIAGDPNLRIHGISELYGPLRQTAAEATKNNWILTIGMMPLSLPTYAISAGKITPAKFARGTYRGLVETPGAVGMEIRRNFKIMRMRQIHAEMGGDAYRVLASAGPRDLAAEVTPRWLRKHVKNLTYRAKMTGYLHTDDPAYVAGLKAQFTTKHISRGEVNNIVTKYPDISNSSRNLVVQSFDDGTLLRSADDIDRTMRQTVWANEVDDFLRGPELAVTQYQQLTDVLKGLDVKSPEDMAHLIMGLHQMSKTYGAMPRQIMGRATVKSRGLPLAERRTAFDIDFDRIHTFMEKAGVNIDDLVSAVKTKMTAMPKNYQAAADDVLNIMTTARETAAEFRMTNMASRHEIFAAASPTDLKSATFWDDFYLRMDNEAIIFNKKQAALNGKLIQALQNLNAAAGIKMPVRPRVVVKDRPLAPDDVARLMQNRNDETSRLLLDVLTAEGDRDFFIEYVMSLARGGYDVGFTRESVGAVYDQIAHSMRVDPNSSSWLRTREIELDSMTRDLHDLYNSKLLPDEQVAAIGKYIDDTAEVASKVMYKEAIPKVRLHLEEVKPGGYAIINPEGKNVGVLKATRTKETIVIDALQIDRAERLGIMDVLDEINRLAGGRKIFIPGKVSDSAERLISGLQRKGLIDITPVEAGRAIDIIKAPPARRVPTKELKPEFAEYNTLRQAASDSAEKWYYKEYPDYTHGNAFDSMMKTVYPFWTYESQRWFWLPRSFMRHPGTLTAWGRYGRETEYGYFHIPGTSIDWRPVSGTIYGPWTSLMRRDYPEYYDSLEGAQGIVEFSDFLQRYGFYPNVIIASAQAAFGGRQQQLGGVLPVMYKTPLEALIAAYPDNEAVSFISEKVFPDRFRNYLTGRRVSDLGGDGSLLFAKTQSGQKLTPEEEDLWTTARQSAAAHSVAFEQFGMFRMRSDESYRIYEEAGKFIEEEFGYTPEQQKWLRLHGHNLWDKVGGLDPWQTAAMQELEYFKYVGSVRPLLPSAQQEIQNRNELDWDDVKRYSENMNQEIILLQQDFLTGSERGRLGPIEYLDRVRDLFSKRKEYIDEKVEANPLMLLEHRTEYYEKYNIPIPVQSPYREIMNMYFSIELEDTIDEGTGERTYDWDKFWAHRAMIDAAIPEDDKAEWDAYISRNTAPMMKVWYEVYDRYFRKYYGLWDSTLSDYPEEEQKLINEFLFLEQTGQQLERQTAIKDMVSTRTGNKLISSFRSEISDNRAVLRYANPPLDAWLFYWGRITTFKTPQAEAIYKQISKDTGRLIE